ncbi:hypothetical protein V3C99_002561 [Haemonchus contortus]
MSPRTGFFRMGLLCLFVCAMPIHAHLQSMRCHLQSEHSATESTKTKEEGIDSVTLDIVIMYKMLNKCYNL